MRLHHPAALALVVGLAGFTGCSGGDATTGGGGNAQNTISVVSCSLGCTGNRCQISEIAQNENIVLVFSRDVDPTTVNTNTIRLRTSSGETPVGEFLVRGSVVEFVPQVLVVGGQTFFGFRPGESYTMTLPGGSGELNSIRSTSNDPLTSTITCTLNVTRGIIDLNNAPPRATLVSPTTATNVPQDAIIQLEFNELLDLTPFLNTTAANGPVVFQVRRTREVAPGERACNLLSPAVPLAGTPRIDLDAARNVSILTYQSPTPLPANVCVQVAVTDRVRDLSGKAASPQTFQFLTVEAARTTLTTNETFDTDDQLDADASSGAWSGGIGTFGVIGGDGIHGPFSPSLGTFQGVVGGKDTFLINTDLTIIPSENTISGNPIAVTDGRFFFTEMVVPSNVRLVFSGANPPVFHVRGKLEVLGIIDVDGQDLPYYQPVATELNGQAGGNAGVFGGAGGRGGNRANGLGANPLYNGVSGGDVRVRTGHAYAGSVSNTGGRASTLFPADGLNASVVYNTTGAIPYTVMTPAGGGGGGYIGAGGDSRVVSNSRTTAEGTGSVAAATATTITDPTKTWATDQWAGMRLRLGPGTPSEQSRIVVANTATELTVDAPFAVVPPVGASYQLPERALMGPPVAGGLAFPLLPKPAGTTSLLHFLVGGAGGGGAASSPLFSNTFQRTWAPGCGGGGGGGAMALRAGSTLRLGNLAQLLASGGSCGQTTGTGVTVSLGPPGGGGSGGSILLQSGNLVELTGLIDVRGGTRGRLDRSTSVTPAQGGGSAEVNGGDGRPGFIRLEVPTNPTTLLLPNAQPAATADNVALLTDEDPRVGFQSEFYSTNQPFGPEYVRYEIEARVNGVTTIFSDDPSVGVPARSATAPIEAYFQAARIDLTTGTIVPGTTRPWREQVGGFGGATSLADDSENGFRFQILFNRTLGVNVVIERVTVVYQV